MTDDELKSLLRAAVPPSTGDGPTHDVWPQVASRFEQHRRWSYLDLGLAAAVVATFAIFPEWLWPLAYHL